MTKRKIHNEIEHLLVVKNDDDDSNDSSDDCYDLTNNGNVGVIWLQDHQKSSEINHERYTTADGSHQQFDLLDNEIDEHIVTKYFQTAIQAHDRSECHSNNSYQLTDQSCSVCFDDSTGTESIKVQLESTTNTSLAADEQNDSHSGNPKSFVQLWAPKELIIPKWMRTDCVDIDVSSKISATEL